jgi:hypothetical protein
VADACNIFVMSETEKKTCLEGVGGWGRFLEIPRIRQPDTGFALKTAL